jgi:hypothetical protein
MLVPGPEMVPNLMSSRNQREADRLDGSPWSCVLGLPTTYEERCGPLALRPLGNSNVSPGLSCGLACSRDKQLRSHLSRGKNEKFHGQSI